MELLKYVSIIYSFVMVFMNFYSNLKVAKTPKQRNAYLALAIFGIFLAFGQMATWQFNIHIGI